MNHILIVTDFGVTTIHGAALDYIGGEEGFKLINNKRRWSKKVKYLRAKAKNLEIAVKVLAQIEYENGRDLAQFGG
jgi:ectoine hydroxylase-related dioxygenase (phytanoyl-CoA dioxygenase family)